MCQAVILLPLLRSAKRIVFHRTSSDEATRNSIFAKLVENLIGCGNRREVIQQTPMEKILSHEWQANKKAALQISAQKEIVYSSFACKVALNIIDDEQVVKYFQGELTRIVSRHLQYKAQCEDLCKEDEPWLFIEEEADASNAVGFFSKIRMAVMKFCSLVASLLRMLWVIGVSLFVPVGYVVLRVPRGFLRKKKLQHYDVAMPVMWGFHDEGGSVHGGVRKRQDDTYLYGDRIKPGRVVHIFGKWSFTPEKKQSYKEYMDRHGLAYADNKQFRLTGSFIQLAWRTEWNLIKAVLSNLLRIKIDRMQLVLVQMLPKLLYYYLEKHLEIENVRYSVELVRDDYNAGHVINTLLCRKYKRQTIGIQHTASPYDAPQLAFVEFDRYSLYGNLYEKLFSPFWNEQQVVPTGREGLDWVIEIYKDHSHISDLKERMRKLYQERKYTVVILFPGVAERCLVNRWKEMYRGLELVMNTDADVNVFLRFRQLAHLEYEYTQCFKELAEKDERFILDHDNFLTQDLMAISDLIITPNASLGINEASAVDKKVLTFDYTNTATLYFDGFGDDFVMTTAEQVQNAFIGLENDFSGFHCDWDGMKMSLNYHTDGRNCERLHDAVYEMIECANTDLSLEKVASERCV